MNIEWLGHSSFLISADSGATLLTDPYDTQAYPDSLFYAPIDESADVVLVSHGHADHGNVEAVSGTPIIVSTPESRQVADFGIRGVPTFHDTEAGALRGDNMVSVITVDGLSICHLGDLGHELSPEQVAEIGPVDLLLLPVGGNFTIDAPTATRVWQQLHPPVAIPMHFRNDKCKFDIDTVEPFLAGKPDVDHAGAGAVEFSKDNLPSSPKIVVLEPTR